MKDLHKQNLYYSDEFRNGFLWFLGMPKKEGYVDDSFVLGDKIRFESSTMKATQVVNLEIFSKQ